MGMLVVLGFWCLSIGNRIFAGFRIINVWRNVFLEQFFFRFVASQNT